MAHKITFASFAVLFFIITISTFTGEATISTSPETSPDLTPATSPSSSSSSASSSPEIGCNIEYATRRMNGVAEETKEFIKNYIQLRMDNLDKFDADNKECLNMCLNLYTAAVGIMEKAISDLPLKRYSNVILSLKGYQTTIDSTLKCSPGADLITLNPEFKGMKEWTAFNIEDTIKRIKPCGNDLWDL